MRDMFNPAPAARAVAILAAGVFAGGALVGCQPSSAAAGCANGGGCGGAAAGDGDALADGDGGSAMPGLVAAYDFDQAAGSVAIDSSGNFNNAGLVGQVTWGTGHVGSDADFMGGYVILPPGILDDARAFSFAAWIKLRTDRIWQRVFDFGNNTTDYLFLTPHSSADTFRLAITRGGAGAEQQLEGPTPVPTGVWKHVAVVLTGSSGALYLDGQPVAASADVTLRPADVAPMGNLWMGRSEFGTDPSLDGEIDQVRIYDRALSAAEVLSLFGAAAAP